MKIVMYYMEFYFLIGLLTKIFSKIFLRFPNDFDMFEYMIIWPILWYETFVPKIIKVLKLPFLRILSLLLFLLGSLTFFLGMIIFLPYWIITGKNILDYIVNVFNKLHDKIKNIDENL